LIVHLQFSGDDDPDSPYSQPAALSDIKATAIDLIRYIKANGF